MNMREMQKMQQKLVKMQEELEKTLFVGTAGGGAVTVTLNGKSEMTAIKIDPEAFNAEDIAEVLLAAQRAAGGGPELDLLFRLGIQEERWSAVVWLVKSLVEAFSPTLLSSRRLSDTLCDWLQHHERSWNVCKGIWNRRTDRCLLLPQKAFREARCTRFLLA